MKLTKHTGSMSAQQRRNLVFVFAMILVETLLIWKAQFGYGGNDESFYLTTAHRLTKGDSLLSQEWHLAQMCSILVYPFMKVYLAIAGTTEGILIAFRYIYILVKTVAAIIIYILLQKKYHYSAVYVAVLFMLFTPYNLLQLCYNSIGLLGLTLCGVMLIAIDFEKRFWKLKAVFAGLSLAAAVLACPYLVLIYVMIAAGCIWFRYKEKSSNAMKVCFYVTVGCGILAVIFAVFVLSRASVSEIAANLPEMMNDPAHPVQSVPRSILRLLGNMIQFYPLATIAFFIEMAVVTVDGIWMRYKRKEKSLRFENEYLYILGICIAITLIRQISKSVFYYNLIMFPLAYLGILIAYIYCWNGKWKQVDKGPMLLGLFGGVYALLLNMSSDNMLTIAACGMALAVFATVLMWHEHMRLNTQHKKIQKIFCAVLLVIQMGLVLYSVTNHAYWEDGVASLDVTVEHGPLKGVVTSKEHAAVYEDVLEDLDYFKEKPSGNFVYFSERPYTYLYMDMPYGSHSGSSGDFVTHYTMDTAYFKLHPEKIPQYIYVEKQYVRLSEVEKAAETYGYRVEKLKMGYALEKE